MTAVMASPRPTPCAPRSQAMWPSRGSDPESRGSRPRRRAPWPAVPAAVAARCSCSTNPGSVGTAANRSIAACASCTSAVGPAAQQRLHQDRGGRPAIDHLARGEQVVGDRPGQVDRTVKIAGAGPLLGDLNIDLWPGDERSCRAASWTWASRSRPCSRSGPS